jgi:hypothetical protein
MKKTLLASLLLMAPMGATAATVITYDDGSTYTLEEGERVFVTDKRLFGLTQTDGVYSFGEKLANTKRDFTVEETADDYPVGSERWCELYEPWSEGYTFNMQWYIRVCPQWGG